MNCECDLRTKLVGDGCHICNPDLAADIAADNRKDSPTFEYLLVPPRGWTDIGATRVFYRETKRGPKYLCRYCGEINEPRHPNFHKPGCPYSRQAQP